MSKIKDLFKRVFSIAFLVSFLGGLCGAFSNALLVLAIYGLGLLMQSNTSLSVMIGSFFAYPLAKLINKYAKIGFTKLFKRG